TTYDVYLGLRPGGPDGNPAESYHGLMDEVSIYNRALSPAEIESIYKAGAAGKCPQAIGLDELSAAATGVPVDASKAALLAILEAMRLSIARGNLLAAIHQLHAFQHNVKTQIEPVDVDLAGRLTAMAQQTLESLDPVGARGAALAAMEGKPMKLQRI